MDDKLPKGWVETTLKETAHIEMGQSPPSSSYNTEGKGFPFFQGKTEFQKIFPEIRKYTTEPKKIVQPNTVLLSVRAPVGPTNLSKVESCIGRGLAGISSPIIPNYFIIYYFKNIESHLSQQGTGTTFTSINKKTIECLNFPLPPLAEQKRIVAKLDQLFGHLDLLKSKLARIPQLMADFRQSVLTQAVTGKLTEDTKNWKKLKLNDVIESIKAGKNFSCPEIPVQKGKVGLIKISAVTWGRFNEKETKTVEKLELINSSLFIKKGDFLISRANTLELVGASVIVDSINHQIMLSDKVWRVNFKKAALKQYIDYFLKSQKGRFEIESRASGNQMSMRNLSQKKFRDIDINLPPLPEQKEIVRRVERLFAKATAIETRYQNLKTQIDHLPQAILAKAFRGELVEQLPTDGDARDLLADIQRVRAELTEKKKKRRKG